MDDPTPRAERTEPHEPDSAPAEDGVPVEGVDHLQNAGREFVAAARSFLDAVESVVEDRGRLGELVESFTGFVGELVDTARGGDRSPWDRSPRDRVVPTGAPGPEPTVDPQPRPEPEARPEPEPQPDPGPDPSPRTGRVRRIPLD